jgi:hypothetical protein
VQNRYPEVGHSSSILALPILGTMMSLSSVTLVPGRNRTILEDMAIMRMFQKSIFALMVLIYYLRLCGSTVKLGNLNSMRRP